jgi:CubicO group peptidase (beta-lactamase class C family)
VERFEDRVSDIAHRTGFSGVVRVDRADCVELENAYGFADRRHRMPNTVTTQFATASATKGLTALAIICLI